MTKLIEVTLIIIVLWFSVSLLLLLLRRHSLVRRLNTLKREVGAEIRYARSPYRSLVSLSDRPEIVMRVGKVLYLIRIYNGGGIGKVVHFASPKYTVRFSRMKLTGYVSGRGGRKRLVTAKTGLAVGSKDQMRIGVS